MPIGGGSHWAGPILGSNSSFSGLFEDIPADVIARAASPYKVWFEDFGEECTTSQAGTNLGTLGWSVTQVNTPAANTVGVIDRNLALVIDCGTTADTGYNLRFNTAPAATATGDIHNIWPQTQGTATLMDGRSMVVAVRLGLLQGTDAWNSKLFVGIGPNDASMMLPTDGSLTITAGGGFGFHIAEDGHMDAVIQPTTTASVQQVMASIDSISTTGSITSTLSFIELGMRARWVDASAGTGSVEYFVNGRLVHRFANLMPIQGAATYCFTLEALNGNASRDLDVEVDSILTAVTRPGVTV